MEHAIKIQPISEGSHEYDLVSYYKDRKKWIKAPFYRDMPPVHIYKTWIPFNFRLDDAFIFVKDDSENPQFYITYGTYESSRFRLFKHKPVLHKRTGFKEEYMFGHYEYSFPDYSFYFDESKDDDTVARGINLTDYILSIDRSIINEIADCGWKCCGCKLILFNGSK